MTRIPRHSLHDPLLATSTTSPCQHRLRWWYEAVHGAINDVQWQTLLILPWQADAHDPLQRSSGPKSDIHTGSERTSRQFGPRRCSPCKNWRWRFWTSSYAIFERHIWPAPVRDPKKSSLKENVRPILKQSSDLFATPTKCYCIGNKI